MKAINENWEMLFLGIFLLFILTGCKKDEEIEKGKIQLPVVETLEIKDVSVSSVRSGLQIIDDGGDTSVIGGIVCDISGLPTVDNYLEISIDTLNIGMYECLINDLLPNNSYFIRAYATNREGTAYGDILSCKTLKTHHSYIQFGEGVTDIDDNYYKSVIIGDQEWMAENLKTTRYQNGTTIEYPGADYIAWQNNISGAYAWFANEIEWKDSYGALYNWHAVSNSNGLCPVGWHVPSHDEWTQLEQYVCNKLGNANCEIEFPYDNSTMCFCGTDEGYALRSCRQSTSPYKGDCTTTEHPFWPCPFCSETAYGTDEFGFSAFPGESRVPAGWFEVFFYDSFGYWWTSTQTDTTYAFCRHLNCGSGPILRTTEYKTTGFSVRCVKDN